MCFYPHITIKTSKEIFTGQLFSYSYCNLTTYKYKKNTFYMPKSKSQTPLLYYIVPCIIKCRSL